MDNVTVIYIVVIAVILVACVGFTCGVRDSMKAKKAIEGVQKVTQFVDVPVSFSPEKGRLAVVSDLFDVPYRFEDRGPDGYAVISHTGDDIETGFDEETAIIYCNVFNSHDLMLKEREYLRNQVSEFSNLYSYEKQKNLALHNQVADLNKSVKGALDVEHLWFDEHADDSAQVAALGMMRLQLKDSLSKYGNL